MERTDSSLSIVGQKSYLMKTASEGCAKSRKWRTDEERSEGKYTTTSAPA